MKRQESTWSLEFLSFFLLVGDRLNSCHEYMSGIVGKWEFQDAFDLQDSVAMGSYVITKHFQPAH